jgi:hypothetical protein
MNRVYIDNSDRPVLVLPDIDGFTSFRVYKSGQLAHVNLQKLKIRKTFGRAQGDLARYAQVKGWKRVGKGVANRTLMDVVAQCRSK